MTEILDQYNTSAPSAQNAVDIFKGEWSSSLPMPGLVSGNALLFDDPRIKWGADTLGGVKDKSVLELGPLEGGHSFMMRKMGCKDVVSIEANTRAFLKCLIVKELLDLQNVKFLHGDFIEYLKNPGQNFDLVIASGVLYHMQDPLTLLKLIANHASQCIIWTHYYDDQIIKNNPNLSHKFTETTTLTSDSFSCAGYRQEYKDALNWNGFCGGSAPTSTWLDRQSMLDFLKAIGFKNIHISFEQPDHPNGPSFALALSK